MAQSWTVSKRVLIVWVVLGFLASWQCVKAAEPAAPVAESPQERDARKQWRREDRFGMFVHWGLYSGLEGKGGGKGKAQRIAGPTAS